MSVITPDTLEATGLAGHYHESMTPQLRRQIVLVVVGITAAIVALIAATYLRQDACLDAGGRWVVETEVCQLAPGVAPPGSAKAYGLGAVIGLLVGTMLWRMYTFAARRGTRDI